VVLFHYALVDDLITKGEFEQRVETKIDECGDLVDEPTAAMMVVGELGREHVKIRGLSAKSSLFSFFGKIIDMTEPKEFDRADGEKGWVATLLLGDETGTIRVVLWDQKAGAVLDTAVGEVLEVIGRHPGKSTKEIYALALRKASCEISCPARAGPGSANLASDPVELDAILIAAEPVRTFTKKDGTTGEMAEAIVGDAAGTARIVAWVPELLGGLLPGTSIHITNAKPSNRSEGRNYSLDEKSTVTPIDTHITVPFAPLASVADQGTYSVQGEVKRVQQPRSFTARDGTLSWVRNAVLHDGSDELRVVLWGENALLPIVPGDRVEIYNAPAKPGRSGEIELGVGRGSVIRVPVDAPQPISFRGTILPGQGCTFIDDGKDRYLIDGGFPAGTELQVTGILAGSRIVPEQVIPVEISTGDLLARVHKLAGGPES
jgi:replication factor A1